MLAEEAENEVEDVMQYTEMWRERGRLRAVDR